ncbi:hypothetical protein AAVH_19189 [Aphelenchoides avenae]|nr:hypothetical protein AAVH_19189 [Aphelenchus avenae]
MKVRFPIWNWDKPNATDDAYDWAKTYDFVMWDFDEDRDYRMPDFFVRKVNNPNCTYSGIWTRHEVGDRFRSESVHYRMIVLCAAALLRINKR